MMQRKGIIKAVLVAGILAAWGVVSMPVASGSNDSTQSAYAERADFVPTACVITDLGGKAHVHQIPLLTGSETVVDAIASIEDAERPPLFAARRRLWIERDAQILPIDWQGIVMHGQVRTNYVLRPGDRLYVK